MRVQLDLDSQTCDINTNIIIKYWDYFCKEEDLRPILYYKFSIDTITTKPVCCRKPQYRLYESKIIMSQIEALIQNYWIEECGVPWDSIFITILKPHQEHVTKIDYFICHTCLSNMKINYII